MKAEEARALSAINGHILWAEWLQDVERWIKAAASEGRFEVYIRLPPESHVGMALKWIEDNGYKASCFGMFRRDCIISWGK